VLVVEEAHRVHELDSNVVQLHGDERGLDHIVSAGRRDHHIDLHAHQ
jgi:hypothetical protein